MTNRGHNLERSPKDEGEARPLAKMVTKRERDGPLQQGLPPQEKHRNHHADTTYKGSAKKAKNATIGTRPPAASMEKGTVETGNIALSCTKALEAQRLRAEILQ